MSLVGKIMDFFADKEKTIPAFPKTKVKAVSDDNNVGLNVLLDGKSPVGHTHTASEVGARPSTWVPTVDEVGAVPTSRTVNGKALSGDIAISAQDVGAVAEPVYTNHFFEQKGWYKIGTMSTSSSARLTLTIGGSYYHNPSRATVIEILGDYDTARCQTIVPTPNTDQITKIGVVTISRTQSEIYAYYNGDVSNTVYFYIHASMGSFTPCTPSLESISESSMMDIVDTSKIVLLPLETKCYGSALPSAGTPGRIFFKKVSS